MHFFWTVRIVYIKHEGQYIKQCTSGEDSRILIDNVWPWVDACIYSFVPFTIIIMLNAIIISQVIKANNYRDEARGPTSTLVIQQQHKRPLKDSGKLTIMLLTISFAFLLMTLPMNVSMIVTAFWSQQSVPSMIRFHLCKTIAEMLMYANHSINFFLYCAIGKKFREQLRRLVKLRFSRTGSDQAQLEVSPHTPHKNTNHMVVLKQNLQPLQPPIIK